MKIVRNEWVCERRTYELELTDVYVQELSKYLQSKCKDTLPPLTAEDIASVYSYETNLFLDQQYTWKMWGNDNYVCTLRDMIDDIVNDDIWDCDYDAEFVETEDVRTEVVW